MASHLLALYFTKLEETRDPLTVKCAKLVGPFGEHPKLGRFVFLLEVPGSPSPLVWDPPLQDLLSGVLYRVPYFLFLVFSPVLESRAEDLELIRQETLGRVDAMAPKLKGKSLSLAISLIGAVGFILQGYDQAIANGLLILDSFIAVFPQVDTVQTTGREKSHNSKIQGIYSDESAGRCSREQC